MEINVSEAIDLLKQNKVIALPTETVYGLAGVYTSEEMINAIFKIKKRPQSKPLTLHIASIEQLKSLVEEVPEPVLEITKTAWPGPLTVIFKAEKALERGINPLLCSEDGYVGFRMPNNPETLEVIEKVGPLVMPSANPSGMQPPMDSKGVEDYFGVHFPVLISSVPLLGKSSTVIRLEGSQFKVLRDEGLGF